MNPSRLSLLTALAALLGLVGGAAAWALLHLIGLITNLALYGRWSWVLPPTTALDPSPLIVLAAVLGGVVVAVMARAAPIIRGHGIPEAMESVLTRQSRITPLAALLKPLSAAVAIGTGGPFGAEGPIIVTGGAAGSLLGQVIPVSPSERKILLASGAAAGMCATFGAPLASVVLAFELLLFEFSRRSLIPVATAAAVAGAMHLWLFGAGPLFRVPDHAFEGMSVLPAYALLGLLCGLLAVVIARGLFAVEAGFRRLPIPQFWHPAVGAVAFATVGLVVPRALGVGYDVINDLLVARLTLATVASLLVAKLVAWWLALGSGTSGGTLAPILIVGSAFGSVVALAINDATPLQVSVTGFALVAMAATFGAAIGGSLTAIVFVFELTEDYRIVLPLILATVLADLVASALLRESIMTEKLSRRGLRVIREYRADPFAQALVRDVMTIPAVSLPVGISVEAARRTMTEGRHSAYPLVDDEGRCRGIVSRTDLLVADDEAVLADRVASRDVVTLRPEDSVARALEVIFDEAIEHVPVTDHDGRLIGMCTRTDILRARHAVGADERRQPSQLLGDWHASRPFSRRAHIEARVNGSDPNDQA
ncbi:MAG: chloride channel protein [Dehalococcoidia bacterium]